MKRGRQREIVERAACMVCSAHAEVSRVHADPVDTTRVTDGAMIEMLLLGYVAGLHAMAYGARAGEKVCSEHLHALMRAERAYVGNGIKR